MPQIPATNLSHPPPSLVPVLLVSYIGWRVYRRTRKNIGRQPLQPKRMIARMVIFCLLGAFMFVVASHDWQLTTCLSVGCMVGLPLAYLGLHLTRFENSPDGQFYTPNTYLGFTVSLLVVVRLGYRMLHVYSATQTMGDGLPIQHVAYSALTMFLFGLLAGYYVAYYAGIFIRCQKLQNVPHGVQVQGFQEHDPDAIG